MDYIMRYNIEILPIDTKDQLADIFTKPLPQETFERLRNKVQGIDWKSNTILIIKQGVWVYEPKGVVTIPHVQLVQFNTAQNIFNAGLKYCYRSANGVVV